MDDQTCMIIVINSDPVSESHICWFTRREKQLIELHEVVNVVYNHPQAPDCATINVIETRLREIMQITDAKAANAILLEASQTAITYQRK